MTTSLGDGLSLRMAKLQRLLKAISNSKVCEVDTNLALEVKDGSSSH